MILTNLETCLAVIYVTFFKNEYFSAITTLYELILLINVNYCYLSAHQYENLYRGYSIFCYEYTIYFIE